MDQNIQSSKFNIYRKNTNELLRVTNISSPTSQQPGDGQMYADRLLRHFVRADMEDVLAHVEVNGLPAERLVIALHQVFVALFKCKQQDLGLKRAEIINI